jgi:uncharacterized membrane protein
MQETNQRLVFKLTATWMRRGAAVVVGIVTFALSMPLELDSRILLAYDAAIVTFLTFLVVRMGCADGAATGELASKQETSSAFLLAVAAILSACSLAGVGLMLYRAKNWTPLVANIHLGLALLAVFLSWTLLHAVFGIHYARLYYDTTRPAGEPLDRRPLDFPDGEQPDFWDFMYFAFTLAVCYQVSDVTIRSRRLRRVALAHMLVSFLNVTIILGLVVEIVSTFAGRASGGP